MPWGRWKTLAALLLACAGCTDLPTLDKGVCGNGVIDSSEDCDTAPGGGTCIAAGQVNQCRYSCTAPAVCPSGWGCGTDGLCSQPSGSFASFSQDLRLPAEGIELGDVNGDGALDLFGFDADIMAVRYGPTFELRQDAITPGRSGKPALVKFDGPTQKTLDIVVPLSAGLFTLRGQVDGRLSPVPYSSLPLDFAGAKAQPVVIEADGKIGSEVVIMFDNVLVFVVPAPAFDNEPLLATAFPIKTGIMRYGLGDLLAGGQPATVAVADVDRDGRDEFLLSFKDDNRVHVYGSRYETVRATQVLKTFEKYTITLPGVLAGAARFVDFDADGDVDVAAPIMMAGTPRGVVARSTGGVAPTFGAAAPEPVFDALKQSGCDADGWPLEMARINQDLVVQVLDYVGDMGICLGNPDGTTVTMVAPAAKPWTDAVVGDLNGDTRPDVATSSLAVGVEVMLGDGSGLFNYYRIASEAAVSGLTIGDFDGDFVADLAVVEHDEAYGRPQQVSVLYSNAPGAPHDPVRMGEQGLITSMSRMSIGGTDLTDDMLVVTTKYPAGDKPELALMFGTTQRTLLAPLLLSTAMGVARDTGVDGLAAGEFSGDTLPDVMAMAGTTGILLGGDGGGQLTRAGELPLTSLAFNECIIMGTGRLSSTITRDQVLAIDGAFNRRCVDVSGAAGAPKLFVATPTSAVPPVPDIVKYDIPGGMKEPRQLQLVDIDNDQKPELLVIYGGMSPAVVLYPNVDGVLKIDQGVTLPTVPGKVQSAAAINAGGDATRELAVMTERGVFVLKRSAGVWTAATEPAIHLGELDALRVERGFLAAGDLTGDGLEDLVVVQDQLVDIWSGISTRDLVVAQ